MRPASAQNSIRMRFMNMPPIMPTRAVNSLVADPAVCMPETTATIETRFASTMATTVYQAYSLSDADPNSSNMCAGTAAWSPSNPPSFARPTGTRITEKMMISTPWMASVTAAARKPPIIV